MYKNLLLLIQLSLDINVMLNYMLPQSLPKNLGVWKLHPFYQLNICHISLLIEFWVSMPLLIIRTTHTCNIIL